MSDQPIAQAATYTTQQTQQMNNYCLQLESKQWPQQSSSCKTMT